MLDLPPDDRTDSSGGSDASSERAFAAGRPARGGKVFKKYSLFMNSLGYRVFNS